MVGKRDCIVEIIKYIESTGVIVNIAKNKARGNQGLFIAKRNHYRIDISKSVGCDELLETLLHEFAHYVHYCYDKSLNTLDFVFGKMSEEELEELIGVTVETISKADAKKLYARKDELSESINKLAFIIKRSLPDFKIKGSNKELEKNISFPAKYLLRYDNIKIFNKTYKVNNIKKDFSSMSEAEIAYVQLKSLQRSLARLNSRISKLNKYYNNPTELWARFCTMFFINRSLVQKIAPKLSKKLVETIENKKIKELSIINKILRE